MPQKTKTPRKKITRAKKTKIATVTAPEPISAPAVPEKKYVVINEYDEAAESKKKLLWPIVGVLGLALVLFWFGTLRYTIKKSSPDEGSLNFSDQLGSAMTDIQRVLRETSDALKNINNTSTPENLEQIKADVLQQIKMSLDSSGWPRHDSEAIDISLQYPDGWQKEEKNYLLTVSTSTGDFSGSIAITKKNNPKNLALDRWLDEAVKWQKTATTTVSGQPALVYEKTESATDDIDRLIIAQQDKIIYEINLRAEGGKNMYEPILEKIFSTIEFK